MRLEANGSKRKFAFYKPSEAMVHLGAAANAPRFEGQIAGKTYSGLATLYTEKCGRRTYEVSGQVENNDERVTLKGQAPRLDKCKPTGTRDLTIVFDFIKQPPNAR